MHKLFYPISLFVTLTLSCCGNRFEERSEKIQAQSQNAKRTISPQKPETKSASNEESPTVSSSRNHEPTASDLFAKAHHTQLVTGDFAKAEQLFNRLARNEKTEPMIQARAFFRLAQIQELRGKRRSALEELEQAKKLVDPEAPLALELDERRAAILSTTPLASVRGPAPGDAKLPKEPVTVTIAFAQAEKRLAAFHRIVVAPRIENISDVLKAKRRLLISGTKAYEHVISMGGSSAKMASLLRLAGMHLHMAESLAFQMPPEMLPSYARDLRKRLRSESSVNLTQALDYYQKALKNPSQHTTLSWFRLAQREAATLETLLKQVD